MYAQAQQSGRRTRVVGAFTAAVITAGMGYFLATGMNLNRDHAAPETMEMIILTPPEPPPPVQEPEPPKVDVPPSEAPPPELVAPDIPFEIEVPPVIVAPIADPAPAPITAIVAPAPSVGSDRSAPKLRAGDKPSYPSASVRAGEQGTTRLEVCISAAGRVTSVSVARSSGFQRLDDAAAKWIRGEKFSPGKIGGVAQSMCGHNVYYEWNLKDAT
jgi:protein TonB